MFTAQGIAGFSMIKTLFIKLCGTSIAAKMIFVTIHARFGYSLKMISMLPRNYIPYLRMAVEAFLSCDFLSLFMAFRTIINAFQLLVCTREFSRGDLCRQERWKQSCHEQ
jgi:hypothetical protein